MAAIEKVGAEGWTELITSNFIALSVSDVQDDFRGELTRCDLSRGITVTEVRTQPSRVRRTARLVTADACDDVLFLVHQAGSGSVSQDQCSTRLVPGYGSLHLASCPYELAFDTSAREIVLQVPRRLLPADDLVSPAKRRAGVAAETPAMRVFAAFTRELVAVADAFAPGTREEMGQTALDLLVSALRGVEVPDDSAQLGPDALLRTMQEFVRTHLDDPDLTAESVARHHHVSLRYAQVLFAKAGTTPTAYIRGERLDRARRALRDVRLAGFPVAAIAHRTGFTSVDTFIRAFRRRFGLTPGEWRAAATGTGTPRGVDSSGAHRLAQERQHQPGHDRHQTGDDHLGHRETGEERGLRGGGEN